MAIFASPIFQAIHRPIWRCIRPGWRLARRNDIFNLVMLLANNRPAFAAPPPYISGFQGALLTAAPPREIMPYTSGQLGITLKLEPAGNIEGKVVVQGTNRPLPGVKLLLLSFGRGLFGMEMAETVGSGADGSFRMAGLRPGKVNITALVSGERVADWVAGNVSVMVVPGKRRRT